MVGEPERPPTRIRPASNRSGLTVVTAPLARRAKALLPLAGFTTLVGFLVVKDGGAIPAFLLALMCLLDVVAVLGLARPPRLEIGWTTFIVSSLFGRREYAFGRCSDFAVARQQVGRRRTLDWVTFDYSGPRQRSGLNRANAALLGANSWVGSAQFGMTGYELAELLNERRSHTRSS